MQLLFLTTGGTCLLDRWPEWQSKFAEFMVHEFGANERTLEDINVKAALNSLENSPRVM